MSLQEAINELTEALESDIDYRRSPEYDAMVLELVDAVDTLFDKIKHGDQKHQDWLDQAIKEHFAKYEALNLRRSEASRNRLTRIEELLREGKK